MAAPDSSCFVLHITLPPLPAIALGRGRNAAAASPFCGYTAAAAQFADQVAAAALPAIESDEECEMDAAPSLEAPALAAAPAPAAGAAAPAIAAPAPALAPPAAFAAAPAPAPTQAPAPAPALAGAPLVAPAAAAAHQPPLTSTHRKRPAEGAPAGCFNVELATGASPAAYDVSDAVGPVAAATAAGGDNLAQIGTLGAELISQQPGGFQQLGNSTPATPAAAPASKKVRPSAVTGSRHISTPALAAGAAVQGNATGGIDTTGGPQGGSVSALAASAAPVAHPPTATKMIMASLDAAAAAAPPVTAQAAAAAAGAHGTVAAQGSSCLSLPALPTNFSSVCSMEHEIFQLLVSLRRSLQPGQFEAMVQQMKLCLRPLRHVEADDPRMQRVKEDYEWLPLLLAAPAVSSQQVQGVVSILQDLLESAKAVPP